MSYMYAGSFVGYLIETYGMEKFEKVYNKEDFAVKFENVYGKSIEALEKEWLTHIKSTGKFTVEEKARFNNLDQINTMLESMDAELFN